MASVTKVTLRRRNSVARRWWRRGPAEL